MIPPLHALTSRPALDYDAESRLREVIAENGFVRVLRFLQGEALKHGSIEGLVLAEKIEAANTVPEPIDARIP